MNHLKIRATGWESIPVNELSKFYTELKSKLKSLSLSETIRYQANPSFSTQAESFGAYVKELHTTYTAILEEMKSSREWIALQVHSTYHAQHNYSDAITLEADGEFDEVQIRGKKFDPIVFSFPWVDNSMENPWKPWGWELDILPDDEDDIHYFFDLKSNRMFVGNVKPQGEISFYNMHVQLPSSLSFFKVS